MGLSICLDDVLSGKLKPAPSLIVSVPVSVVGLQ